MEVLYECACGLDIHKDIIVATLIKKGRRHTLNFGTVTRDLLQLSAWLKAEGCLMVAMESTGVYWRPIYNVLEADEMPVMVVNAQHIKAVPGRKTDVKDSEWIADLTRHGLLRASYIPNRNQRELRELVRYRTSMIQERARELNRIQKMLEGANIKLGSVVSSIDGLSATAMIDSIIAGETDAKTLAHLAQGALRKKIDKLELALDGLIGEHLQMILQAMRLHVNTLAELIEKLDTEIERRLQPVHELVEALDTIPGVGIRSAQIILAEIGTDMRVFPTAHHLASWAGLCPGNYMSAGKQKSSRTRKCNKSLKTALAQCAKTNSRSKKGNYLTAQYRRLAARRGANRATIAVAHSILIIAYHIIKDGTVYRDLGGNYFDERKEKQVINRSVKRLEALGYDVTVREKPEVSSA